MSFAKTQEFKIGILKALGIPVDRCRSATIILEPQSPILVNAEYLAEEPVDGELEVLLKEYKVYAEESESFEEGSGQ